MAKPNIILLDANTWVKENLLQSAVGKALIYHMTQRGIRLALPEIVEREVDKGVRKLADGARSRLLVEIGKLSEIIRRKIPIPEIPSTSVDEAVEKRWQALSGIIDRVSFGEKNARKALDRILATLPPCGPNNEQFRDCCIWEDALQLGEKSTVYLVSSDLAFYQNKKFEEGLSKQLASEAADQKKAVFLSRDISDLLEALGDRVSITDYESVIRKRILEALTDEASPKGWGLPPPKWIEEAELQVHSIRGFGAPAPAELAVDFDVRCIAVSVRNQRPAGSRLAAIIRGTCTFDMKSQMVSEIDVTGMSQQYLGPNDHRQIGDLTFGNRYEDEEY